MNFGIPALVLNFVAFLLEVIGLSIPYWLYFSQTNDGELVEVNLGLWKACRSNRGKSSCVSGSDYKLGESYSPSLDATRATVIISVLLLVGAISCLLLKLFVMKQKKNLPRVAGVVAIVAGVFGIIGCAIFAAKFGNYKLPVEVPVLLKLHASFGLCIVASLMGIVSGVLSFLMRDN